MYAKLENPLSVKNIMFGLLLAASLILPTLAHADGLAVLDRAIAASHHIRPAREV